MTIKKITINDYKVILGKNKDEHVQYARTLELLIPNLLKDADLETLDVYNLKGEKHSYKAGDKEEKRVCIFGNATSNGADDDYDVELENQYGNITHFLQAKGDGLAIMSPAGLTIAEWYEDQYTLNILFDIFSEYTSERLEILKHIMVELNRLVFIPKTYENSWKHTTNKDALTSRFVKRLKEQKESELYQARDQITSWERESRQHRQKIKSITDNLLSKRRYVETEAKNVEDVSIGLVKDLDLIIAHPKIKDLMIKDNKFIITTESLIINATDGRQYLGGEYRIEIITDNAQVNFFNAVGRRGYWTGNDPHPHVDGNTGEACFGNVGSTIAELCSQMQIYALMLVSLDFLESANLSDVAGRRVENWDKIGDDGEVIEACNDEEESDDEGRCYECGERATLFNVFNEYDGDGEPQDEREVCINCRDNQYNWDSEVEEFIRD